METEKVVAAPDPALHLEHDITSAIVAVKKGGACVTCAQLMAQDERAEDNKLGALAGKDVGAGEEEFVTKAEAAAANVGVPIGMIGAASAIENPSGVKVADTKAAAAKPSTAENEKRVDSEDKTIQDKLSGAGKVVVEDALSGDKAGPSGGGTDDTAPPERGEQDGLDALGGMVPAHVTGAAHNTSQEQLEVAGAGQIPATAAADDDDSDHEEDEDEDEDDDNDGHVNLPDDVVVLEAPPPAAPARHFLFVVAGGAVALTAAILMSPFTNTDHGILHPPAELLLPSGDLLLPPGPRGGTSTGVPLPVPALAPLLRAPTPLPPPASSAPMAGDVFEFEGQRFGLGLDARGGTSTGVPPRGGGTSSPFRSLSVLAGMIFAVLITGMVITGTIIMLIFALLLLYIWVYPWGILLA